MTTHRGFSTLEMLIAMTVLTLAISATVLLFPGIQSGAVDTQTNAEALGIAQRMLESEQALARKDFKLVVATTSQETIDGIRYTKTVTAVSTDYFTKQLTATVSWGGMYLRSQSVLLAGVVSDFQNVIGGDTCDSIVAGNWSLPQTTTRTLGAAIMGDSAGLYPITDLDAYRKRLYVTVNNTGTLPSLGANHPGTVSDNSGTGSVIWANPANAKSSNDSPATAVMSAGAVTHFLKATNFGFTLPPDATILGIQVKIERKGSSTTNTIKDNQVKLVRADGTIGTLNQAHSTNWGTADSIDTYGGAADLWGETGLSPAALNSSNFGVAFAAAANTGTGSRTASVDDVQITVTYTKQLYVLNASTPTNPSFVKSIGQNSMSSGFNAVVVATSTVTGDYAYVATNSASAGHLQVIDLSPTPAAVVSTYTIPSSPVTANTIFYKDGYVYLGLANNSSGPEFVVIDVHNPLSIPTTPLGTYEVGAGINGIYVKNGYAFLGTDRSDRELVVVDLNDLAHPALRGTYDAPGAAPGQGKSLYTVADTLYFGRYYSSNAPEFAVMNTAVANPGLLGTSDIGTSGNTVGAYGTIVRGGLAFLLTGNATGATSKVQIFNVSNAAAITSTGSTNLVSAGEPRGFDCESNYLYAASVPTTNKGSISVITGL